MNENNLADFTRLLKGESEIYPNSQAVTAARIQAYFASLSDFDLASIEQAFLAWRRLGNFFPSIKEITDLLDGGIEDRAALSWETFLSATGDGGYASVKFLDAACAYAVERVFTSWIEACAILRDAKEEMVAHHRKNFCAAYASARIHKPQCRSYHKGIFEIGNSGTTGQGLISSPVILIGLRESKQIRLSFDLAIGEFTATAKTQLENPAEIVRLAKEESERYLAVKKALRLTSGDRPATAEEVKALLLEAGKNAPAGSPFLRFAEKSAPR